VSISYRMSAEVQESDILGLGECFKDIVSEKTETIEKLKKGIIILYSLFVILDNEIDNEIVERGRGIASTYLDQFIFEND